MSEEPDAFDSTAFLAMLGEFVLKFAQAEKDLHEVLVKVAGLDRSTALAILSGTRVATETSYLRRLFEIRGEAMPRGLARCLDQLATINDLRDLILHNGARHWTIRRDDGSLEWGHRVTNAARAARKTAIRDFDLTEEMLDGAIEDLGRIIVTFWAIIHPTAASHWDPDDMLRQAERESWRYKSPGPNGGGQKPPKTFRRSRASR